MNFGSISDYLFNAEPETDQDVSWIDNVQDQRSSIMAICTDSSRSGCAIYSDSCVQLVADRKDPGDPYKGFDIIIQRIDPEIVVVSAVQKRLINFLEKRFKYKLLDLSRSFTRQNKKLKTTNNLSCDPRNNPSQLSVREQMPADVIQGEICDQSMHTIEPDVEETSNMTDCAFTLIVVPNTWFCMSKAIQKLHDSEMVASKGFTDQEAKNLFITTRIQKFVDVCAVRAISAIENYISYASTYDPGLKDQTREGGNSSQFLGQSHPEDIERFYKRMPILDVKYIEVGPVLSMDKFTIESLNILRSTYKKPDKNNQSGQDASEIPSLYDILNQCQSIQGKKQLQTIMLWPLQDIIELEHRYSTLEYFMKNENLVMRDQLMMQLKNLIPLSRLLTKLSQSVGSYRDWTSIYKALWSFITIIDLIKANIVHNLEILNRIVNLDSLELRNIVETIIKVVDFEASNKEKRIQVHMGIDQNVDEKKEIVKNLSKFCNEVAIQETAKYRDILRKICTVVYIPRIGFLNSVEYSSNAELTQIKMSRDFDVLLHTEKSVYFKTKRMEELDNNAGDLACDLIDVQENVVISLQEKLLKHTDTILRLMELCGELDCLIAFSVVSQQRNYTRPEFSAFNDEIDIRQAYHPLHFSLYNIVPNDVQFYNKVSRRKSKILILTGPNSCGKTTYMKTTCLVIYMAHIGCFVPAQYAKMPIIDAIFTRIHSANSISTGLSSFASDLHQINHALNRATERSFLAIDEFGKGTQARDGFHLLKGLIKYFAIRSNKSPHVIVATHYNRLIDHLQSYSEYILYRTFGVTRDLIKNSFVYDFNLLDGVGEVSLADEVASRAGIPQIIISRANQMRNHITGNAMIGPRPACGA